jgi:uncharacterized membrane protein YiaA
MVVAVVVVVVVVVVVSMQLDDRCYYLWVVITPTLEQVSSTKSHRKTKQHRVAQIWSNPKKFRVLLWLRLVGPNVTAQPQTFKFR